MQRTQDTCTQNINNKRGTILPVFSQNIQIQNALIKKSLWDGEKLKGMQNEQLVQISIPTK